MSGTPGRPLSAELSEQLLSVAVDILAEEGWGRLNSDRIAARARAGKAGIYRRWPTMAALARARAWAGSPSSPPPEDAGSLRDDLVALAARWTRPLDREERAVASIVGAARHEEDLRAGLDAALVAPAGRRGRRARCRGPPAGASRSSRAGWRCWARCSQAFWWQRYTAAGDGAMTVQDRSSAWSTTSWCRSRRRDLARSEPARV